MKYTIVVMLVVLGLTSCQKKNNFVLYEEQFLRLKPKEKGFEKSLQKVAEGLYAEKWGGSFKFDKPTIRKEAMIVEWENQKTNRVTRKKTSIRYENLPEKLALLLLFSHLGTVSPEKLMKSEIFQRYKTALTAYLQEDTEGLDVKLNTIHKEILDTYKISEKNARENEDKYNIGILYTTGFYLGMPFYKRITLDDEIQTRYSYLNVYLHECGHQLFDKHRSFSKSIKLGLSWIGWRKSTSWWTIEEKSCNIFADLLLAKDSPFLQRLSIEQKKKLIEVLQEDTVKPFVKNDQMVLKYAKLFYDTKKAEERFSNKRINDRYSVEDAIGLFLKKNIIERGLISYIKTINQSLDTTDAIQKLKKGGTVIIKERGDNYELQITNYEL